jgi:hypothetical protein
MQIYNVLFRDNMNQSVKTFHTVITNFQTQLKAQLNDLS